MRYPETLFIPLLMLSDYFLTIWGSVQRDKGHSKHFQIEHYELNPVWQNAIKRKKILNVRLILSILVGCGAIFYIFEYSLMDSTAIKLFLGFICGHYGLLIGRHLSNILTYSYVAKNPETISGQVNSSYEYNLHASLYQYSVAIVPLVVAAIFNPSPFIIGCAFGSLFSIVYHKLWLWKYRKNKAKV